MNKRVPYRVKFEINTAAPLPVGEQVFIAGSPEELGRWKPDGLPLSRVSDDLWAGAAACAAGEPLEFKITRGSWETEETGPDGRVPSNQRLEPGEVGGQGSEVGGQGSGIANCKLTNENWSPRRLILQFAILRFWTPQCRWCNLPSISRSSPTRPSLSLSEGTLTSINAD